MSKNLNLNSYCKSLVEANGLSEVDKSRVETNELLLKSKSPRLIGGIKMDARALHNSTDREDAMSKYAVLNNSNEADLGFKYNLTTLTGIMPEIIMQKFFVEEEMSKFAPISEGLMPFWDEAKYNRMFIADQDPQSGFINPYNVTNIKTPSLAVDNETVKRKFWGYKLDYNILELEQANRAGNWQLVQAKYDALREIYKIMMNEILFTGHKNDASMPGLLNQPNVTPNNTIITKRISDMTPDELNAFLGKFIAAYRSQSGNQVAPDMLLIPQNDKDGMASSFSAQFPVKSKIEQLEESFRRATGNENAQIIASPYLNKSFNSAYGINKSMYLLYRNTKDALVFDLPIDFTSLALATTDGGFSFQNLVYGQIGHVFLKRPQHMMYMVNVNATE